MYQYLRWMTERRVVIAMKTSIFRGIIQEVQEDAIAVRDDEDGSIVVIPFANISYARVLAAQETPQ